MSLVLSSGFGFGAEGAGRVWLDLLLVHAGQFARNLQLVPEMTVGLAVPWPKLAFFVLGLNGVLGLAFPFWGASVPAFGGSKVTWSPGPTGVAWGFAAVRLPVGRCYRCQNALKDSVLAGSPDASLDVSMAQVGSRKDRSLGCLFEGGVWTIQGRICQGLLGSPRGVFRWESRLAMGRSGLTGGSQGQARS